MIKIIKHLKPFAVQVLIIVILLAFQAGFDLALPDYTSNIVNIGIQQNGVDSAVPRAISASSMDILMNGLTSSEKEKILVKFTMLDKVGLDSTEFSKYIQKYPALENESIYIRNTKNKTEVDELKPLFEKAIAMQTEIPSNEYILQQYKAIGMNVNQLQINYILVAGLLMISIALLSMISVVSVAFLGSRVAAGMGRNLRTQVFRKVMNFSSKEMDEFSTASLITRSTNDIQQIQNLMVMLLRVVFYAPILAFGGLIKVLYTDVSMAWIIAIAVGAIITLVIGLFSITMPRFKKVQKLVDKVNLVMRENLTGMLVIRAFSTQKHEEQRFDKANENLTSNALKVNQTMAFMMPLMMLIMNIITILIVWQGAQRVDAGTMQVGNMMAFIQYTMQIIMSFFMISMVSIMLPRATVSAQRIDEILTCELSILDKNETQDFITEKKGIVEFKNVSFKYPGAEEYVLENINFKAKPGETTAFIGSTGSGKSTLINLIPRFYDATEGEILVGGVNIKDISQKKLREKIGYVPQKGVLFSGTIRSNITYGNRDATEAEIMNFVETSQSAEFIKLKSQGLEEPISQGGSNVSGGQKQRLSIARAIAKMPDVYIFDDSFSALDYRTDVALRKALKSQTLFSTVLIVAQRISTIIHAEQIIVLDDGVVAGIGNHSYLMENCEVYKEIALSQLSKEELENE